MHRHGDAFYMFATFTAEGRLLLTLHHPNRTPEERARFIEVEEVPGGLALR